MIPSSERARLLRTALALLAGNALYSLTVVLFLVPSGLITGGATGIALAANRMAGLPVSAVLLAVNVVMLVVGWVLLGRRFAVSTLASTFLSPLTLAVWERLFAGYVLTDDLFLNTVFAGLGIGGALGLVIRVGGSTGGMDIPPLVLQKYFRIPVAVSMTVFDLTILFAQAVSSPRAQVLYGVVLVFVYSTVLDKVILLGTRRTEVKLVSTHTDELRSAILSELDRGVTLLAAEGGYLRQPGHLLLTVISHRELPRLERLVHAIDPACFMVVSEVTEVGGCDRDRLAKAVSRVRIGTGLGPLAPAEWGANTSRLTDRYCAKLHLPPATAACARRIVESECDRRCREMTKGSWSPSGFVAAVIFVAAARTGCRVTARDVSEAVCIDVSTVGRYARMMRTDLNREWT